MKEVGDPQAFSKAYLQKIFQMYLPGTIVWHIVVILVFVFIREAMYKTRLDLTDRLSLGGVGLAGPYLTPSVSFPITLTNPPNSKGQSA